MKLKANLSMVFILFFDILAFYLSLFLAYFFRKTIVTEIIGVRPIPFEYIISHLWLPLIFLIFMFSEELYTKRRPFWSEFYNLTRAVFFSTIVIFSIVAVTKTYTKISRITIVLFGVILVFLLPIFRYLLKYILYKIGLWRDAVHLVYSDKSSTDEVNKVKGLINSDFYSGVCVEKVFNLSDLNERNVHGKKLYLYGIYESDLIDKKLSRYTVSAKELVFVSNFSQMGFLNYEIFYPFRKDFIFVKITNNLFSPINLFLKSLIDYILFFLTLPLFLILLVFISIAIKVDSRGPIVFIQERIGKDGKLFKYFKFRTMYVNSDEILEKYLKENPKKRIEWEKYKKLKDYDPRVTRVGKFLRKTSLDELPQIFNVFFGQMSFVGPRPYLPREKGDMGEYYNLITKVKPGLTGLWQVSGRSELNFEDRLKMDEFYIKNWSLWLDFIILVRTIKTVVKGEGAY